MRVLKGKGRGYTVEKEEREVTSYEVTPVESNKVGEEESVSAKAKETGQILKELVAAIWRKSKSITEQKTSELKEASKDGDVEAQDAADIQMLGSHIEGMLEIFDQTMDEIGQEPYDEQQKLLAGFKKVLQEEVNVINARLNMAKRLKLVEGSTNTTAAQDAKSLKERKEERLAMNTADAEIVAPPIVDEPPESATLTEEKTLADLSK
jgi:Rad3-related DNA helicase